MCVLLLFIHVICLYAEPERSNILPNMELDGNFRCNSGASSLASEMCCTLMLCAFQCHIKHFLVVIKKNYERCLRKAGCEPFLDVAVCLSWKLFSA